MKVLAFALCLLASSAALAEDRPPIWIMVIEFKSGIVNASYGSQEACLAAAKTAAVYAKSAAKFHCIPVLAQ